MIKTSKKTGKRTLILKEETTKGVDTKPGIGKLLKECGFKETVKGKSVSCSTKLCLSISVPEDVLKNVNRIKINGRPITSYKRFIKAASKK